MAIAKAVDCSQRMLKSGPTLTSEKLFLNSECSGCILDFAAHLNFHLHWLSDCHSKIILLRIQTFYMVERLGEEACLTIIRYMSMNKIQLTY